ncbi:hypothetical protein [Pseudomonas sp. UBA4617]|uniref:hypothetical protein n=1 Tax=Pseudomonas sp. UBA4617 TaxID=1947318 RepID=UPI0025D15247|nr:hypothetical protein [Pseudomonas sp. UBA4617]
MYTKAMLEVLGLGENSHIHILNSELSSDKAGYDCYLQDIWEDRIRVLSSENKQNFNVATKYWDHLYFYSEFRIREAEEKLAERRQKFVSQLPKVLSPAEDILFGRENTVRVAVGYTIDDGPLSFIWGIESEINRVLACTNVNKQSTHKLVFTSSPEQAQVRTLLQKFKLITEQVPLYGISEFAEDFYKGMKYPTVLSHTAARKYLSRLPKAFVAWEISQSLTNHSDVRVAPAQWKLEHELAPNELSRKNPETLSWLRELLKPSKDADVVEHVSKHELFTTLIGRETCWKASTTKDRLSVIMVARRSSLLTHDMITQVSRALPVPEDPYDTQSFSSYELRGEIERAIELSTINVYNEMDVFRYFNSGDPVTVNGCARYWGTYKDEYFSFTPTPKYADLENLHWSDIKSFESLEKSKQEIANEFSEFFKRGWRLVKASYHDKLHTLPYPLLLERRLDKTHAYFQVGKVSEGKNPSVVSLIHDDDTEALQIEIANPRFLKKISTGDFPYDELSYVFFFLRDTPAPDFVDLEATRYQAFVHAIAPDYVLELPDLALPNREVPNTPPALTADPLAELPCMTGFERSELGTGDCVWASPCHVLADRDLQLDESVHVWAVDPIDGRVLKTVSLKATEANKARVAWPAALVKAIQADRTLVEGSVLLQAGHLSDDAEFTENTDAPTSQTFTGYNNIEKGQVDRLWAFDSHCKLLSNLPFKANQVSALRLPDAEPPLGERICIQVRHRTSQHLYESHFYQPEANSTRGSWSKQMCEFLNQHSAMLRAGKLQDDGISITPAEQGNQLWIPQLSDLSVQLESVIWLEHASFTVNSGLALDNEVMIAVHDHVTGAPLPGSPFTFRPSDATQAQEQWPSALARQLAGSPLAPYIKLEQASSGGTAPASTWRCLRAAVPLRIWMSEPLATPAWSSRSGADIDAVLDACLGDDSFQLLIESHDTRTGYLCHNSSITLPAMESSLDQAAKRAQLANTLEEHLKQNGVVWLGLSIEPNASSTSVNHWKLCEATALHLQTTLEKIIPAPIAAENHSTPFYIDKLITNGPIQEYNNHILKADTDKLGIHENYIDPALYLYLKIFQEGLWCINYLEERIQKKPMQINIFIPHTLTTFDTVELLNLRDRRAESVYVIAQKFQPIGPIPQKAPDAILYIIKGYTSFRYNLLNDAQEIEPLARAFLNRKLIKNVLSDVATTQSHLATIEIRTSSTREQLCIALDTQAIDRGFSLASCSQHDGELTIDLNYPFEPDEDSATAGILIGILSPTSLWKKIQSCTTTKEVFERPAQDTLCADMANTAGTELFASTGPQPHGVSPQTGLFHFHHTIATLSSLSGNTPAIPLAFNYSPLRANESALGDGFAFSGFSSYDNRNRRLVLGNGTVHEFSIDEIKQLIDGEPIVRLGYTLKAGQGTNEELSAGGGKRKVYHLRTLTIELLNGHEEVLGLPQTHDNLESGEEYKDRLKSKINEIIKKIDAALEELKTPSKDGLPIWSILGGLLAGGMGITVGSEIDEHEKTRCIQLSSVVAAFINTTWGADLLGRDLGKIKQVTANSTELNKLKTEMALTLADVERNALILVPLQLKADSRALQLAWQGVKGHVRLKEIKDGVNVLLKAEHSAEPMLKGSQQSVFTLWPETDERCCITLDIKDCLLRRLTRSSGSQPDKPDQRLHFQYAVTPVLDNILCGVTEDDGSREVVAYDWRTNSSLPRVVLQTLVPGGQQPSTHHAWAWEGEERITAATRYAHAPVGSDLEQVPSTRWEWSHSAGGVTQLARLIEKVPGEQQRITRYVYQTDNAVPEPLRQPRQTEQHITVEDLRVAATAEEQQP